MGEWAGTDWGLECAKVHERMLAEIPGLEFAAGPDLYALRKTWPSISFIETSTPIAAPRKASRPGARNVADRLVGLSVFLVAKEPTLAEEMLRRFIVHADAQWGSPAWTGDGRSGSRPTARPAGRSITDGVGYVVTGTLRLMVFDDILDRAKPVANTNAVAMAVPGSATGEDAELQNATP
jgi:hypothetical protein